MGRSKFIGQEINGFKILDSYYAHTPYISTRYVCKCVLCGKVLDYSNSSVLNGKAKCVCNRKRKNRNGFDMRSRIYNIYRTIIKRTQNPKDKDYKNYGGRGITLCQEWNDDYRKFYDWAMNNGYSDKLTIDRIDNDKGYSPENCRWVDVKTQINNTRANHRITYKGETHTLSEWADKIGIDYGAFKERIYNGWSVERAITTPLIEAYSKKTKRDGSSAI